MHSGGHTSTMLQYLTSSLSDSGNLAKQSTQKKPTGQHPLNEMTVVEQLPREMRSAPPSPWHLFREYYDVLKGSLRKLEFGVPRYQLLFVHPPSKTAGSLALPLNEMTPSFYVIGRHSEATIRMPPDATLSLRHALVQVSWHQHQPRVQIMDLQTHQGFRVWEDGRPLHTHYITCTGHAAGTIGHCHWLLIANRSGAWPDKAEDAWDKWMKGQFEHSRSLAHLMNQSERIVGGLSINRETFFLSVRELASGVLLGRYSRCDIRREDDSMLSRVHAFLWMEAQTRRLWLVDAASTNGIQFHRDRASRPRRLPGSPHQEQAYLLDNRCKWSLGEQSMSWLYLPNHPLSGYMA